MSQLAAPAALEQHALLGLSRALGSRQRMACVVPTTSAVLARVKKFEANAAIAVVSPRFGEGKSTLKSLLSRVGAAQAAPKTVVVFSDQILDPADATLFVRHDSGDGFFSPLEAILNIKYDYELDVWAGQSSTKIPAGAGTVESVLSSVVGHVRSCETLGDLWRMRELQGMRTPAFRIYQARRKLRFFKSAVVNAYAEKPTHPELARLLAHAEAIESAMTSAAEPT
jgi:hypothetical protein